MKRGVWNRSICVPIWKFLREAEVGEADVALPVQEDVLRFQVPVDDFFGVQVLDGTHYLCRVEESGAVAEAAAFAQVAEQLAAWHVVH